MKSAAHWILEKLERIEPWALPQSAVFVEMNSKLRPPMTEVAFKKLLAEMKTDQLIDSLEEKYEDEPKWLIKEAGKALLRK